MPHSLQWVSSSAFAKRITNVHSVPSGSLATARPSAMPTAHMSKSERTRRQISTPTPTVELALTQDDNKNLVSFSPPLHSSDENERHTTLLFLVNGPASSCTVHGVVHSSCATVLPQRHECCEAHARRAGVGRKSRQILRSRFLRTKTYLEFTAVVMVHGSNQCGRFDKVRCSSCWCNQIMDTTFA